MSKFGKVVATVLVGSFGMNMFYDRVYRPQTIRSTLDKVKSGIFYVEAKTTHIGWLYSYDKLEGGNGVLVTNNEILTCYGLVKNCSSISVKDHNNDTRTATVIRCDESKDLCLLQLDEEHDGHIFKTSFFNHPYGEIMSCWNDGNTYYSQFGRLSGGYYNKNEPDKANNANLIGVAMPGPYSFGGDYPGRPFISHSGTLRGMIRNDRYFYNGGVRIAIGMNDIKQFLTETEQNTTNTD